MCPPDSQYQNWASSYDPSYMGQAGGISDDKDLQHHQHYHSDSFSLGTYLGIFVSRSRQGVGPSFMAGGQVGGGSAGDQSAVVSSPVRRLSRKITPTANAVKSSIDSARRREEKCSSKSTTAKKKDGPIANKPACPPSSSVPLDARSDETSSLSKSNPVPPYPSQSSQPSEYLLPPYPASNANSFSDPTLNGFGEILSPELDPRYLVEQGSSSFSAAGGTAFHHQQATFGGVADLLAGGTAAVSAGYLSGHLRDQLQAENLQALHRPTNHSITSTGPTANNLSDHDDAWQPQKAGTFLDGLQDRPQSKNPQDLFHSAGHSLASADASGLSDRDAAQDSAARPPSEAGPSLGALQDRSHGENLQALLPSPGNSVTTAGLTTNDTVRTEEEAISGTIPSSPKKPGAPPKDIKPVILECAREVRRVVNDAVVKGGGKLTFIQMLDYVIRELNPAIASITKGNGWNIYEKLFALNKDEELRLSKVDPTDANVVSKCYESFQMRHPNFSEILHTFRELHMVTPRVMSSGRRNQVFRTMVEKMKKLSTECHEKLKMEVIILLTGSMMDIDKDLHDIIFTPFAEEFFQENAKIDPHRLMVLFKSHVYKRSTSSEVTMDFGMNQDHDATNERPSSGSISPAQPLSVPEKMGKGLSNGLESISSSGPGSPHLPEPCNPIAEGNSPPSSILTRYKADGGAKNVQELLKKCAAKAGIDTGEGKHFPWTKLLKALILHKISVYNWPEQCPFPGKELDGLGQKKSKGLAGLKQVEQLSLYASMQPDAKHPLKFKVVEGPEKNHTKLIYGVPPAPDSCMKQRIYVVDENDRIAILAQNRKGEKSRNLVEPRFAGYGSDNEGESSIKSESKPLTKSGDIKEQPPVNPEPKPTSTPGKKRSRKAASSEKKARKKARRLHQEGGGPSHVEDYGGEHGSDDDSSESECDFRKAVNQPAPTQEDGEMHCSSRPTSPITAKYPLYEPPSSPPHDATSGYGTSARGSERSCTPLPPNFIPTTRSSTHSPRSSASAASVLTPDFDDFGEGARQPCPPSTVQEATAARQGSRKPSQPVDEVRIESGFAQREGRASIEPEGMHAPKRQRLDVSHSKRTMSQPYLDENRYPTSHPREDRYSTRQPAHGVRIAENLPNGWPGRRLLPFETHPPQRPPFEGHPAQRHHYGYGYPPPSEYQDDYEVYRNRDAYTHHPSMYAPQQPAPHYYSSHDPEWRYHRP